MIPRVAVIVVNFNGGSTTLECVRALEATDWPTDRLELIVVDNASTDGVVDELRRSHPRVRTIVSTKNLGFAGGNNLALRGCGGVDHVALVNPDAFVPPGWLSPLTATLAANPEVGAACPKVVLTGRYLEVAIESATQRRGRGDRRDLGVRISGIQVNGRDAAARTRFRAGTWGPESGGRWTDGHARCFVPVDGAHPDRISFRLDAEVATATTIRTSSIQVQVPVGTTPGWFSIDTDDEPVVLVNSVGTDLTADYYARDRGWLEPDVGQFDEPTEVFAWTGAAVLLRGAYLDDVGLFDESLFLYYEDLELAWRGRTRGWRYHTAPDSVVEHEHAAATIEGSPLSNFHNERNHLMVVARHAPAGDAVRAWCRHLLVTMSYACRDAVSPLLRGRTPAPSIVRQRLRAFVAATVRIPRMLAARRTDRRGRV